jgi:hypothetical protein
MNVPARACRRIGLWGALCALAGVILQVSSPLWCDAVRACIPPNAFLALALIAVTVITFFSFLAYGTQPEEMRTAIAVA